jgi:hypothetical protein
MACPFRCSGRRCDPHRGWVTPAAAAFDDGNDRRHHIHTCTPTTTPPPPLQTPPTSTPTANTTTSTAGRHHPLCCDKTAVILQTQQPACTPGLLRANPSVLNKYCVLSSSRKRVSRQDKHLKSQGSHTHDIRNRACVRMAFIKTSRIQVSLGTKERECVVARGEAAAL